MSDKLLLTTENIATALTAANMLVMGLTRVASSTAYLKGEKPLDDDAVLADLEADEAARDRLKNDLRSRIADRKAREASGPAPR